MALEFAEPVYSACVFNLFFERREQIRRDNNTLEDTLGEDYLPPQSTNVPDGLEPVLPRFTISSKDRASTVRVSQISIAMAVDPPVAKWPTDSAAGIAFMTSQMQLGFKLVKALRVSPSFCGINLTAKTSCNLPNPADDLRIPAHLWSCYMKEPNPDALLHDFELKTTTVHENQFFNNIKIENYRAWNGDKSEFQGMPSKSAQREAEQGGPIERGIMISVDFNDRYKYNEIANQVTAPSVAEKILLNGFAELGKAMDRIRSDTNDNE